MSIIWQHLVPQRTVVGCAKLRQLYADGLLAMVAYSHIRWWSRWEVMVMLAENVHHLQAFQDQLIVCDIGKASAITLRDIYNGKMIDLQFMGTAPQKSESVTRFYGEGGDGRSQNPPWRLAASTRTRDLGKRRTN